VSLQPSNRTTLQHCTANLGRERREPRFGKQVPGFGRETGELCMDELVVQNKPPSILAALSTVPCELIIRRQRHALQF